ncbi:GGDEF domain-containing protein [Variovorax ginsengisoli]|uniref:diguanylate cyclase n=1 Tax=Variovorax ginsengisoli TaxID=363844 RepID=A0ABT9S3M9_9BURK|nr:GGDEF domain-containing protein [Variovorax ginsengisoli]MDP9898947.1 diguanylate cyclase (GGDEF)-like protein [Variovorax ginsengisoli]
MKEIRLSWSPDVSHQEHDMRSYGNWTPFAAELRRDYEIVAETANEIFGEGSHWVEERQVRRLAPDRLAALDDDLLTGEAATSAYARQLQAGFRGLRFEPALEQEYVTHVRMAQRPAGIVCGILALVTWLLFLAADFVRMEPNEHFPNYARDTWVILSGRVLVIGLLLFGLATKLSRRHLHRHLTLDVSTALSLLPMTAATGIIVTLYKLEGKATTDLPLLLLVMSAFFPLGFVFRQALFVASVAALLGVLPGIILLPSALAETHERLIGMMLLTTVVAGVGGYLREQSHREQFLLRSLLAEQAYLDPLTGLHNRRWLDVHITSARLQAARERTALAFILLDIDQFKAYNDHYGHEAGDAALTTVANVVNAFARRPLDVASRLDGDEFALLLYDCRLEQARRIAEQLRIKLSEAAVPHARSDASILTASVAAVEIGEDENPDDIYRRADLIKRRLKQAGRDRAS